MNLKLAYPGHPGWTTTPHPLFDDHYELIVEHVYSTGGQPPRKKFFGSRDNRSCLFCGRGQPEVAFKKDSHAIPAGLGNRHLFSLEECDDCNVSDTENELLKMVEPQRVFSRIPKRKGLPKLRAKGSESFIEGKPDEDALTISIKEGEADPTVVIQETGVNSIEILHHQPPFRPISAIRSILRSAWMVMPPAARQRHPIVLSTALGKDLVLPLEFFKHFLPGGLVPFVALRIYEKKTGALPGAELIVSLMVSNTIVVWCSPQTGRYEPSLLPPLITLPPQFSVPTGTLFKCASDAVMRSENSKFTVQFESKHDGPPPKTAAKAAIKKVRRQASVRLEVHAGGRLLTVLQSILIPHRFDERVSRFVIEGGELAASLTVHVEQPSGVPKFTYKMDLVSGSVIRAKKTLDFFDSLREPGSSLRIVTQDGKPFGDLEGFSAFGPKEPFSDAIGWLARISVEFAVEIACPKKIAPEELRIIEALALGIDGYRARRTLDGPLTIKCDRSRASELLAIVKEGKDIAFHGTNAFDICGVLIDPGPYRMILPKPATEKPLAQVEADLAALNEGDIYLLELKTDALLYEFDKWLKGAPVPTTVSKGTNE